MAISEVKQKFVDVFGGWISEKNKKMLLLAVIFLWPVLMVLSSIYIIDQDVLYKYLFDDLYKHLFGNEDGIFRLTFFVFVNLSPGIIAIYLLNKKILQKFIFIILYTVIMTPGTMLLGFWLACDIGLADSCVSP
ncbi:MAG: hypothetical protein GY793_07565 [Proteobacteria bacterium]|nr:hypothetical protein [Pseudomonadota bacterium]